MSVQEFQMLSALNKAKMSADLVKGKKFLIQAYFVRSPAEGGSGRVFQCAFRDYRNVLKSDISRFRRCVHLTINLYNENINYILEVLRIWLYRITLFNDISISFNGSEDLVIDSALFYNNVTVENMYFRGTHKYVHNNFFRGVCSLENLDIDGMQYCLPDLSRFSNLTLKLCLLSIKEYAPFDFRNRDSGPRRQTIFLEDGSKEKQLLSDYTLNKIALLSETPP